MYRIVFWNHMQRLMVTSCNKRTWFKFHCAVLIIFFYTDFLAQTSDGGWMSLGVRSTVSVFNHGETGSAGTGVGGQFRLQFAEKVNSDWFFDYLTSDVGKLANRVDYHIGWSVLFYPLKLPTACFKPYFLAGHCFDYTRLVDNQDRLHYLQRWSSAIQGGAGIHWNFTDRFDVSLTTQYMLHLGSDIYAEQQNGLLVFSESKGASLEGHLLINLSVNYKIADLW
jgi:hypothetical protein